MELPWPLPANCNDLRYTSAMYTQPTFDPCGKCILSSPLTDFTSKDLPWPLPVRQYERSHASVLNLKPTVDQSGKFVYHTYAIRYEVVEVGMDPLQQLASDFALITPGVLASEVAQMSVNLYLPWQTYVKANISECRRVALDSDQIYRDLIQYYVEQVDDSGVIESSSMKVLLWRTGEKLNYQISHVQSYLDHLEVDDIVGIVYNKMCIDQVDLTKRFNTWLFDVVLGKPLFPPGAVAKFMDSPKSYYVLPLRPHKNRPVEFDWPVVISSLTCGLVYKRKVSESGGFAKLDATDLECGRGATSCPGEIIMRNGIFLEEDLDDAMITGAHMGLPCYVTAISKHLNGSSCFPSGDILGIRSYVDYFTVKCEYLLKYQNQSLLKCRRLSRACNYLKRQEIDTTKGKVAPTTNGSLELPPEICSLHLGVKGTLCRGAMRLPSVLYSIETALLAAELRDLIGVPMSCFKVLEALTSRACGGDVSYEGLELLGDSVLKLTGCTYLFLKEFLETKEQLGATLYELVRNKTMYYCADARSLARYAVVETLGPGVWIPPGLVRGEAMDFSCPVKEQRRKFQLVSCRTLADIVEALLGAYLMDGGLDIALRAMAWLWVPIKFPVSIPEPIKTSLFGTERSAELCKLINVDEFECKLGYIFKDKNLLAGALKYEFHDSPENSLFKRLEFLGDGILDYVITRHLIRAYPDQNEGKLTELRQAIRNRENLACVAVVQGLHTYLRRVSPSLEQPVAEYINYFMKEGGKAFGLSTLCAPRGLGDLLQTLTAAMYLDSNFDVELVWRALRPLLEPMATPLTVTLHPIKQLETLCGEKGWSLKIHVNHLDKHVEAEVWINELVMGNSQNEDKKVARRLAATMALRGISHENSVVPNKAC